MVDKTADEYKPGASVKVFYRSDKQCQPGRKYFAAIDRRHGIYRPRVGLTEGWVPARVAAEHGSRDVERRPGEVCIEYRWPFFFTLRGQLADLHPVWTEWYPEGDVRPFPGASCDGDLGSGLSTTLVEPGTVPDLAIISFRWGGVNGVVSCEQWGSTGSSVSDTFFTSFIDSAVGPRLGRSYEVWTMYIEDGTDMNKVAESAHLIFGESHPARRAKTVCAMYFLYPTGFEENCIPTQKTGEDNGAALVDQSSFFRMIKAVERAGIPTRFPHCSGFYELLTSKRWTHLCTLSPQFRVPPTVSVPRMLTERSTAQAAEFSLRALEKVRGQQALLRGEPCPVGGIKRGVAKLGHSWEALDVKYWEGQSGLAEALLQLTQIIEISDELTGQPQDLESVLVQEYVEHDLELRLYVVEGQVEASIYTKFCRIKENKEFGDFKELFTGAEAASQWMGGDAAALADGERQCREALAHWLVWVEAQVCEVPAAIRFDFFVGRTKDHPGRATVWTLEICELGFSMLGEERLPAKVFAAILRSMIGDGTSSSAAGDNWGQSAVACLPAAKRSRCSP